MHRHLTIPESGLREMPKRDPVPIVPTYISALFIPKCLLGFGLGSERVRYGSPGLDKLQKRGSSRRVGHFFAARHREIHASAIRPEICIVDVKSEGGCCARVERNCLK